MRVTPLFVLMLLATPQLAAARAKRVSMPPKEIVKGCLSQCRQASQRCGSEGQGRGVKRRGLRRCGCAYVRCKQLCRRYGAFDFACTASSRPRPHSLMPRSDEQRCKTNKDCGFRPPDPCSCKPCGLRWRQVSNQAALRVLRKKYLNMRCPKRRCKSCARHQLGRHAYCSASGYCHVSL
ncbi:MAG: hypothetical protein JRH20_06090 [Deltaproteobacteria bacterium]|nr:hypothetical protein [Deltaproteobacteria bacterium]